MKPSLLLTCLLIVSASAFGKGKSPSTVHVISTKSDIFYFKVSKFMIGAKIEVTNDKGEILITDVIKNHKNIIDFYNENPGHFFIRIIKCDVDERLEYTKESVSIF
jgi:hypothetical protein